MPRLVIDLPDELAPFSNDLRRFVDAMVFKLRKNVHKGRWEDYSLEDGVRLLNDEMQELRQAVGEGNTVEVMLEGADVANMALIVASIMIDRGGRNGGSDGST